jgi:hypothetical protein
MSGEDGQGAARVDEDSGTNAENKLGHTPSTADRAFFGARTVCREAHV